MLMNHTDTGPAGRLLHRERVRPHCAHDARRASHVCPHGYARPPAPSSTARTMFSYRSRSEDLVQDPRLQDRREVGTMAHFTNGGRG
jgi:hypothetical protein